MIGIVILGIIGVIVLVGKHRFENINTDEILDDDEILKTLDSVLYECKYCSRYLIPPCLACKAALETNDITFKCRDCNIKISIPTYHCRCLSGFTNEYCQDCTSAQSRNDVTYVCYKCNPTKKLDFRCHCYKHSGYYCDMCQDAKNRGDTEFICDFCNSQPIRLHDMFDLENNIEDKYTQ